MITPTKFNCPICDASLVSQPGQVLDPNDGVTLFCPNLRCDAQEVFGHARNEKEAFEIIKDKYLRTL
jgi:transcription elongation factor Elf1